MLSRGEVPIATITQVENNQTTNCMGGRKNITIGILVIVILALLAVIGMFIFLKPMDNKSAKPVQENPELIPKQPAPTTEETDVIPTTAKPSLPITFQSTTKNPIMEDALPKCIHQPQNFTFTHGDVQYLYLFYVLDENGVSSKC